MSDPASLLRAYDAQVRLAETSDLSAGVEAQVDGPVVRVVGDHRGFVTGLPDLGVAGAAVERLVARQRDFFAARGEAVEWKVRGHDVPSALPDVLRRAGFVPEPTETVMVAEAAAVAARGAPALPPGVTIRAATTRADVESVVELEEEVWSRQMSWFADELAGRLDRGAITMLVAETKDRVVCAGWLSWRPATDFCGLWGGSTLASWRGRGLYRTLVARRAALADAGGVRFLYVDASDESRPILERLGFTALTTTTPYVWNPAGEVRSSASGSRVR